MSCYPSFYSNFISLIPDEQPTTISIGSETGWYILYPPSNSTRQQLPIPIYHTSGQDTFVGWTSQVSLDCIGNTNYSIGKCTLVYLRVEEAPTVWGKSSESPVSKTELALVGRCIYPKVSKEIHKYPETYCFYTVGQFKTSSIFPFDLDKAKRDWTLGFASYRDIPGQVLVNEKIFGTPVNLDLRAIGSYAGIIDSYGLKTVLDPVGLQMATVEPSVSFEGISQVNWTAATQSFSVVLDGKITTIAIVFSNPVTGNLSTYFNNTQTIEEIIPGKAWRITTILGLTNLSISLAGIIAPMGTVVTINIGNQVTEINL